MNTAGGKLDAGQVIASFDSATVLHAGLAAALHGRAFPHLGHGALAGASIRVAGNLPWPLLRRLYTRIGASEGLDPRRLGDVDLNAVAKMLAAAYPQRPYPGVLIGSSNGALSHLAAAMQVPWLPTTVLIPVARRGDPQRPVDALRFGQREASALLEANPGTVLHHMHDQVQDELMVAQMTYFRMKWRGLPPAYTEFLSARLAPGAPVVLVEDQSQWPVVQVGERHFFQSGAQGGQSPEDYLARPHTPRPDTWAPEAEWGAQPQFGAALAAWCAAHGHPLRLLSYQGPQAPAHAVARLMRRWYTSRGEAGDRLIVPSFILGDPWATLRAAAVPYWTFFAVKSALDAFHAHLQDSSAYRAVDILLFQHGVRSLGIAEPDQWLAVARRYTPRARLLALDPRRSPHDVASLGRYAGAFKALPAARRPWSPLSLDHALEALRQPSARS